jgi:glycerol-3-phosphate dehydrogenase (NAD(P)+)
MTRGLAEISRLSCEAGGRRETSAGLSGLGDLVLTCTSNLSRNRRVGLALARGEPLDRILAQLGHVAEGVVATRAAHALALLHHVDMPIVDAVHRVLYEAMTPRDAVLALLAREPRGE